MFDLSRPWVLVLLLPLAFMAWRRWKAPLPSLIQALPAGWGKPGRKRFRSPGPWLFRVGGLGLLVVALAGPVASIASPHPPGEGVAIMLALDLSGSMDTPDLGGQSRLQVAREEVGRFVRARSGDLLGLVTFGEEAVTRIPPTTHHPALLDLLSRLEVARDENGTALGTGLGLAVQRIAEAPSPSRAVVLVTDGRNNTGSMEPLPVARAAMEMGVTVYTIGLGKIGGDDPLDEPLLEEIAGLTGGRFFRARDPQGFAEVMREIDAMEKGLLPVSGTSLEASRHRPFLILGILLLLLEGVLWRASGGRIR